MIAIRWLVFFSAFATLSSAATVAGAASSRDGCYRCMAIYHAESGRVLQTCPGGSPSGGLYCIVQESECRTVGVCTP
jgi:hypothetical protein